ncbi:autophagy protein Apg9 [Aspergillus japonicus CBS 114.51]|uniref:Autophagy-related protein 9 n=2 Tax=Aspergillus TaxID=5052 RepID=A0A2V5HYG9_ASPV1|nr:autophagy protein Apg9 [Aspergillus japonicus CBS 114.51]PYI21330.1 autophagy protein Apg9 [Aspergillus violaceofuscus CBS 115571]RAH84522.1 autophagy protein Apg9 [Aspergillus japonicus CBS 114.51]
MMTSNILSRFLPPHGSPSVYETIRQHDSHSDTSDIEERAGLALGDEHLGHFNDDELEEALADAERDESPGPSDPFLTPPAPQSTKVAGKAPMKSASQNRRSSRLRRPRALSPQHKPEDSDDEVPASLLVEGDQEDEDDLKSKLPPPPPSHNIRDHGSHAGPSSHRDQTRWETARGQLPVHSAPGKRQHGALWSAGYPDLATVDPKVKAMWMWANVENLDNFLKEVYTYYLGNGIWSILLNRALSLLTFAFVVGFSIFLTNCIDYRSVRGSRKFDDIYIQQCTKKMSFPSTFLLWLLSLFWIGKSFQYILDIRRLKHMHDFYHYLLGISDPEIQTISWQEVVSRLMTLRDSNPATAGAVSARNRKFMGSQSKQRMDAHDIANRLMRKENYLIALVNKDILDLTLPVPFLRNRQLFSRTLEWNINLCVMDYVFNEQGQVRTLFLKDTHRRALSDGLRRRFIFAGIMNIFAAPFIVVYFMTHYFFRYFNEYKKNPSQIGSRQYTPLAEWKFREFNELWHLFERRTNMSYPFASRYVDQFPKDKTVQVAGFVAFVSGALGSVLALASIVDPELFLGFEITPDRTVLFYLGVFGSIWAVAQGMVPEETNVFDPEYALLEVINFTHYFPGHWKGRLHSDNVRKDFATLYQMKIVIFLEEIMSMIFTPFILWFSLPKCSDRLIDFFREFTVHVDGMGYLCSFAVFDFKKGTNVISQADPGRRDPARQDLRADYFSTKDGKMLASYYGFLDNYGANPRPSNKRQFHPPPTFPTLGSPSAIEMGAYGERLDGTLARPGLAGGMMGQQSAFGAPRFGPPGLGDHTSPAPSILLDPHHQPSASGFRTTHRASAYSRYRPTRPSRTISDPIADEDGPSTQARSVGVRASPHVASGSSGAGIGTSDSNLGESWRMNLVDERDEDGEEREGGENVDALAGGAGVLGLIQRFQQVSKDNRGRTTVGL